MCPETFNDPSLLGWRFSLREISNGAWEAEGRHMDGRFVSRNGNDEAALLRECIEDARMSPRGCHHA
jgi:hypothetical protein